jgi:hypothetical protein
MSNSVLNSSWDDKANVLPNSGIFDDSLSDFEWKELEELGRKSEDCLDTEGF